MPEPSSTYRPEDEHSSQGEFHAQSQAEAGSGSTTPRRGTAAPDPSKTAYRVKAEAADRPRASAPARASGVGTVSGRAAWRRLGRMGRPRATRANFIVGLLAVALGFAIAAQVRQTDVAGLANLREDELVRILDNVTQENARLSNEIRELEATRLQLASGATTDEVRAAVQARLDTIRVLSGSVSATGPGIVLTIDDPEHRVNAVLLLDALQELRDAGAEVVDINGVRVVASTYFTDLDGGVTVSGTSIEIPYVVSAIGDPPTMSAAMDIPGGVRDRVRGINGQATVEQRDSLDITSLHIPTAPEYAQPVPSPTS
ncbi:MAG: DUF881 domain-containing protein [Actinomycetia bacterium]|nr:DUF881 domain-containing protein [Actinomycetes bacterium]